eukprot:2107352-Pleurochrysis_carterae.AAC.1
MKLACWAARWCGSGCRQHGSRRSPRIQSYGCSTGSERRAREFHDGSYGALCHAVELMHIRWT